MTPFAWAITASFICATAAAWFSGYVVGTCLANKRSLRFLRKIQTPDGFAEEMAKRMDEEHGGNDG